MMRFFWDPHCENLLEFLEGKGSEEEEDKEGVASPKPREETVLGRLAWSEVLNPLTGRGGGLPRQDAGS